MGSVCSNRYECCRFLKMAELQVILLDHLLNMIVSQENVVNGQPGGLLDLSSSQRRPSSAAG